MLKQKKVIVSLTSFPAAITYATDAIKSILEGVKNANKNRKIISVFEPHRYSRVLFLQNQFAKSFVNSNF